MCICVLFCVLRECVRGGEKESDEKAKESKGFLFSSNVIKKKVVGMFQGKNMKKRIFGEE